MSRPPKTKSIRWIEDGSIFEAPFDPRDITDGEEIEGTWYGRIEFEPRVTGSGDLFGKGLLLDQHRCMLVMDIGDGAIAPVSPMNKTAKTHGFLMTRFQPDPNGDPGDLVSEYAQRRKKTLAEAEPSAITTLSVSTHRDVFVADRDWLYSQSARAMTAGRRLTLELPVSPRMSITDIFRLGDRYAKDPLKNGFHGKAHTGLRAAQEYCEDRRIPFVMTKNHDDGADVEETQVVGCLQANGEYASNTFQDGTCRNEASALSKLGERLMRRKPAGPDVARGQIKKLSDLDKTAVRRRHEAYRSTPGDTPSTLSP